MGRPAKQRLLCADKESFNEPCRLMGTKTRKGSGGFPKLLPLGFRADCYLSLVVYLSLLFDVRVELRDVRNVAVRLLAVGVAAAL